MTQRDTFYRIGLAFMGFVGLYLGFLWWTWLVGRMSPEQSGNIAQKAILAGVVFVPILMFLWLMARLIRPNK
jgi:hypothetical protein